MEDKTDNKNIEAQKTHKPGFISSVRRVLAKAGNTLDETLAIRNRKVPIEEINEQKAAETILQKLGNPLREMMGQDRFANPFDITDVLANMGYVGIFVTTDYLKKFPQAYQAAKLALVRLEQDGVLEKRDFDEQNSHRETIEYKVISQNKLKEIATKPKEKN